ncbi:J domain-containing protein [Bosea sp. TWI1241]|uniref:J domain-containing protein n=1 Tax=Bosea sp. TWI1241 TaxID=3148904 RepID=UPI0032087783
MTVPFPLVWPIGFPRAKSRRSSQFKTSLAGALKNVQGSLRLFGSDSGRAVTNVVISSNVSLGQQRPADPGVAVWFSWDGEQRCFAVDLYAKPEENLQAIHHVLEARRTEMRHAGVFMAKAAMEGFAAALPAPRAKTWCDVLKVNETDDLTTIETAYRRLAAERHPDRGGSDAMMAELNAARDQARKAKSS